MTSLVCAFVWHADVSPSNIEYWLTYYRACILSLIRPHLLSLSLSPSLFPAPSFVLCFLIVHSKLSGVYVSNANLVVSNETRQYRQINQFKYHFSKYVRLQCFSSFFPIYVCMSLIRCSHVYPLLSIFLSSSSSMQFSLCVLRFLFSNVKITCFFHQTARIVWASVFWFGSHWLCIVTACSSNVDNYLICLNLRCCML